MYSQINGIGVLLCGIKTIKVITPKYHCSTIIQPCSKFIFLGLDHYTPLIQPRLDHAIVSPNTAVRLSISGTRVSWVDGLAKRKASLCNVDFQFQNQTHMETKIASTSDGVAQCRIGFKLI